jgi:hypothetical protein
MRFVQIPDEAFARAREFDDSAELFLFTPPAVRGEESKVAVIADGFLTQTEIRIFIGEQQVLRRDIITTEIRTEVGSFAALSGPAVMRVELVQKRLVAWVQAEVQIAPGRQATEIQQRDSYPPRIKLGNDFINPVPGLRLRQKRAVPAEPAATSWLRVIDRAATPLEPKPHSFELSVDGERVCLCPEVWGTAIIAHAQRLRMGVHHVRIGIPQRNRILVDTIVACNGADDFAITLSVMKSGHADVEISRGSALLLQLNTLDAGGFEGVIVSGEVGEDVDIPPGVSKEELQRAKGFSEKMRDNYREFLKQRKSIREKDKGEPLTKEEEAIRDIKSDKQLQDWVRKKKEAEGYHLIVAGTTSVSGRSKYELPEPKTPWEKFQKDITMNVHEPSHQKACEADAKRAGLDWKELQPILDAILGNTMTKEQEDWITEHSKELHKFIELRKDPERIAEEEMAEYEEEIRVFEAALVSLNK